MQEKFIRCSFEDITQMMEKYVQALSSPIDSFMEDHIVGSVHFLIMADGKKIGYFSIFESKLLTQFYIEKEYRHFSQEIFHQVKKMQHVREAFVPTSDEFLLAHVVDNYSRLDKQAYFFQDSGRVIEEAKRDRAMMIRLAESSDGEMILQHSGDFFGNLQRICEMIAEKKLYIATKNDELVGFGVMEKGRVMKDCASIGMFVLEQYRGQGVGRNILLLLKEEVYQMGLRPVAGCWYYNHFSKKTLESAGMYAGVRLLRVGF